DHLVVIEGVSLEERVAHRVDQRVMHGARDDLDARQASAPELLEAVDEVGDDDAVLSPGQPDVAGISLAEPPQVVERAGLLCVEGPRSGETAIDRLESAPVREVARHPS